MGTPKYDNHKNPVLNIPTICPICSGDFSYFTTFHDAWFGEYKNEVDPHNLYKCSNCNFIKILPEPTLDKIKSFYPEHYYSHQDSESNEESKSFAHQFYSKLQDAILDRWYKKKPHTGFFLRNLSWFFKNSLLCVPLQKPRGDGKFLDIGSGSGYLVDKLSKYDWNCKGIDIIGEPSENNIIGDFLSVPFENKFEYIRIHGVIEHVIDPDKYFKKVSELLENNGECHISAPNSNCLSFKIFKKYWIGLDVPRHIQVFNDQNMTQLLRQNNLEVIKISPELSAGGFLSCIYVYLRDKFKIPSMHPTPWFFLTVIFLPLDFLLQWTNQSLNMVVVARKSTTSYPT